MSMISEQVKELREEAEYQNDIKDYHGMVDLLSEAADTIESLSAKLQAADMERSADDCGGGWIYCGDGNNMPEEHDSIFKENKGTDKWNDAMFERTSNTVIVTVEDEKGQRATMTAKTLDGKWKIDSFLKLKVIAWRPFPNHYEH